MKRLILTLGEEVIEAAKQLAQRNGTSVSALFSAMVHTHSLVGPESGSPELSPRTRKLTGIIQLPPGKTDRQIIEDALLEHYGMNP